MTDGFNQDFTLPNRNASGWDSDLNSNFQKLGVGYVMPGICANTAINTGQLAQWSTTSAGYLVPAVPQNIPANAQYYVALQAASPGNTLFVLTNGGISSFAAWDGAVLGFALLPSISTPGWITSSREEAAMFMVARVVGSGAYNYIPTQPVPPVKETSVKCGFAHCASGSLGVFSFEMYSGYEGYNTALRIRTISCDNYRVTFWSNSARTNMLYDTVINSGNLGVRTIDMQDNAGWPYTMTFLGTQKQLYIHGRVEVLSSAATAINSAGFRVDATWHRIK